MQPQTNVSQNSIGFLLLSGAGIDSWAWQEVIKNIQVPAVAVDFPKSNPNAGMKDYVNAALTRANELQAEKIIVVGHSLSGVIGLKVADALGDRVAGFVGVAAAISKNGGSFISSLPFPQKIIMPLIIRLAGTKPSDDAIRKSYCNDLTQEQTAEVISRYKAEAKNIYFDASAVPPAVPKLYIKTTRDVDFPVALQDKMSRNLGAERVAIIDSGHLPMVAKPMELAAELNAFILTLN